MTRLGQYLSDKAVNRAAVSRKTGIKTTRFNAISNDPKARLTAKEVYLIALALEIKPAVLLDYVCEGVRLKK